MSLFPHIYIYSILCTYKHIQAFVLLFYILVLSSAFLLIHITTYICIYVHMYMCVCLYIHMYLSADEITDL